MEPAFLLVGGARRGSTSALRRAICFRGCIGTGGAGGRRVLRATLAFTGLGEGRLRVRTRRLSFFSLRRFAMNEPRVRFSPQKLFKLAIRSKRLRMDARIPD